MSNPNNLSNDQMARREELGKSYYEGVKFKNPPQEENETDLLVKTGDAGDLMNPGITEQIKKQVDSAENKTFTKEEEDLSKDKKRISSNNREVIAAGYEAIKKETGENTKETKESSEYKKNLDLMQAEAEAAFEKYLEAEGELQRIKNQRGIFNKMSHFLTSNDQKEGHINKEFVDKQKELEEAKKAYREKYQEFANETVERKKQELKSGGSKEDELKDKLRSFIMSEGIVSRIEKDAEGNSQEKKLSLIECMNENEKKLLQKRLEALSEKKKGMLGKLYEGYSKLGTKQKIAVSVALSAAIGTGVMLSAHAAVGVALGYGAWKGGKTLLRRITMGAATGVVIKGIAGKAGQIAEKAKQRGEIKTGEKIASKLEKGEVDIFSMMDAYHKKCKTINRVRNASVVGTALVLGGTVIGFDAMLEAGGIDELKNGIQDVLHHSETNLADLPEIDPEHPKSAVELGVIRNQIGEGEGIKPTGTEVARDPFAEPTRGKAIESQEIHNRLSDDNVEHLRKKINSREMYKSMEDFSEKQEQLKNSSFELAKGGNVWRSLEGHFGGDRQEVGKVLLDFKKDTVADLVKNHGMTEAQANQFMDWRYRHMNVGAGFELKDGKLDIPGFADDSQLERFKTATPPAEASRTWVDQAIERQAQEDIAQRAETARVINTPPESTPAGVAPEIVPNPEIEKQAQAVIDGKVKELYKGFASNQIEEWDTMKNRPAGG